MCVGYLRMTFHLTGHINDKSLWLQHALVVKLILECESQRLFGHIQPLDLVKRGNKFPWNLWLPRLADIKTLFDFGGNLSQVSHLLGTKRLCWRIFCWLCTLVTKKKSCTPPTQYPALVMLKKIHRAPGARIQPARSDWSASTCRHMALFRGSLTYWSSSSPQRCSGRAVPLENTVYSPPLTQLAK